jgi:hypothetical protein
MVSLAGRGFRPASSFVQHRAGAVSPIASAACASVHGGGVQADCPGGDRRIAFIHDCLALDQGERAPRRDSFVESVVRKRGAQRLIECLAGVGSPNEPRLPNIAHFGMKIPKNGLMD